MIKTTNQDSMKTKSSKTRRTRRKKKTMSMKMMGLMIPLRKPVTTIRYHLFYETKLGLKSTM